MAVRHVLIKRPPHAVWSVLSDGSTYADWVVGTSTTHEADANWPAVGSAITYTVKLGPLDLHNRTVVRVNELESRLELEAYAGVLGTARIAIEIRPWGDDSLVVVDEHPLRGPGARLHNTVVDAAIMLRHRSMLDRFAEAVERLTPPAPDSTPATETAQPTPSP
ncbi:SRPBCC family protein [Streptomyces sp. H39-S7]|uniref:SRPBCC family protein n=1 Tax=Streptomyces sp. H39-S7 TaxID=3004357 RepID=UPI0022AFE71A|nr:SRPBCC family protein [Streptomyces sp. H39-S7]MCZ4119608.1 SRPBCC family protein [Streptomyces sp. H39-S7]